MEPWCDGLRTVGLTGTPRINVTHSDRKKNPRWYLITKSGFLYCGSSGLQTLSQYTQHTFGSFAGVRRTITIEHTHNRLVTLRL